MNTPNKLHHHRIAADAARETAGAMCAAYLQASGLRQDALAPMHGEMTA